METVWIMGVGKFGLSAYKRLSKQRPDWQFVLVDLVRKNLIKAKGRQTTCIQGDAVQFLTDRLTPAAPVSWIIPSLPLHLVWEWCRQKTGLETLVRVPLPSGIMDLLPNPMQGADNTLYVSNANFFCPATCSEPDDVCTATKKPRKQDMFKTLANVAVGDFCPVVVQSHQLGPGIGGFRPDQLFSALNQVVRHKGHLLVCTACRCHGVITGAAHIPG